MTDHISREALLKLIGTMPSSPITDREERLIRAFISTVKTFLAADVRPVVRGKWESHGEGFKWVYICSACGYVDGYPLNDRMNFCPNCGAWMDGDGDV